MTRSHDRDHGRRLSGGRMLLEQGSPTCPYPTFALGRTDPAGRQLSQSLFDTAGFQRLAISGIVIVPSQC